MARGPRGELVLVGAHGVASSDDGGRSFRRAGSKVALQRVWSGNGLWALGPSLVVRRDERSGKFVDVGPKRKPERSYAAIDGVDGAVWVGTLRGAMRTLDGGDSWELAFERDGPLRYATCALSRDEAVVVGSHGTVVVVSFE